MIVGVDWGNHKVKYCTKFEVGSFYSQIIDWQEDWIDFKPGKSDFIFEYQGRKGIIGQIAYDEKTALDTNKKGDTKLHEDALIRLLVTLHRLDGTEFNVVVGQPINQHQRDKKQLLKMVIGAHKITVNGKIKTIKIKDARIGVEGASAFLSDPKRGTVHLIDIGSGTINLATIKEGRFINTQSTTIPQGVENLRRNPESVVRSLKNHINDLGWKEWELVYLLGGGAHIFKDFMKHSLLEPLFNLRQHDTVLSNSIGFYKLGENTWAKETLKQ